MQYKAVIFDLFETLITEWGHKKKPDTCIYEEAADPMDVVNMILKQGQP